MSRLFKEQNGNTNDDKIAGAKISEYGENREVCSSETRAS